MVLLDADSHVSFVIEIGEKFNSTDIFHSIIMNNVFFFMERQTQYISKDIKVTFRSKVFCFLSFIVFFELSLTAGCFLFFVKKYQ